jgi:hypothetical protein
MAAVAVLRQQRFSRQTESLTVILNYECPASFSPLTALITSHISRSPGPSLTVRALEQSGNEELLLL